MNKEKAQKTYEMLQKRKEKKARKTEGDFPAHTAKSVDRTYKRTYQGRKRRGQP